MASWTPFCPRSGLDHVKFYGQFAFCAQCGSKNPAADSLQEFQRASTAQPEGNASTNTSASRPANIPGIPASGINPANDYANACANHRTNSVSNGSRGFTPFNNAHIAYSDGPSSGYSSASARTNTPASAIFSSLPDEAEGYRKRTDAYSSSNAGGRPHSRQPTAATSAASPSTPGRNRRAAAPPTLRVQCLIRVYAQYVKVSRRGDRVFQEPVMKYRARDGFSEDAFYRSRLDLLSFLLDSIRRKLDVHEWKDFREVQLISGYEEDDDTYTPSFISDRALEAEALADKLIAFTATRTKGQAPQYSFDIVVFLMDHISRRHEEIANGLSTPVQGQETTRQREMSTSLLVKSASRTAKRAANTPAIKQEAAVLPLKQRPHEQGSWANRTIDPLKPPDFLDLTNDDVANESTKSPANTPVESIETDDVEQEGGGAKKRRNVEPEEAEDEGKGKDCPPANETANRPRTSSQPAQKRRKRTAVPPLSLKLRDRK